MDRRRFLKCLGCGAAAASAPELGLLPDALGLVENAYAFDLTTELSSVEARYYKVLEAGGVECRLCPRHCLVTDLERGYCGVRENRSDTYVTLVYGRPCSLNIDPIEKKPLFHFLPGTTALSLATAGCNVNCKFCQNWEISQVRPEQTRNMDLPPEQLVGLCQERHVPVLAYTYSEPVIFYEYMYDSAELGHREGIKSVMITGGYMEEAPLRDLIPQLDAIKVDLKSIRESFYKHTVDGELKPILDRLVQMKTAGVWLEIVNLVVPTLNDTEAEFRDLGRWIKNYLGVDVPVHFSRFHPQYLLKNLPPTPRATLERAREACMAEGLQFVYIGNLPGHDAESTYCPGCGQLLIGRRGYRIYQNNLKGAQCTKCQRKIPGVF